VKFEALYPTPKRTDLGPVPDRHPDPEKYPDLIQSGGHFPCQVCGALTNFQVYIDDGVTVNGIRDYYAMVCSEECCSKALQPRPVEEPLPAESLLAWLEGRETK
jgi:hypothetical protein